MDFRDLAYIVAISKHQSVTKAANELHVTQPTLSKFVQNLERQLGQPVFRRIGNKFLLTYAGERYVRRAMEILDIKKQLDQELSDIIRDDIGELNIGFPITRGTYMLPAILPVFREKYPHVMVHIFEANSEELENMILRGEIDIAFFNMPIKSGDIGFEVLSLEEFVLIMSPIHPLIRRGVPRAGCKYPWMDLEFVRDEPFVLQLPKQRSRQTTDRLFRDARIEPPVALQIRNILASVQLAVRGYGLSFVTESHLRHVNAEREPAVFSVGNPSIQTSFVAAFRRGVYLPQYARDFIKIVKAEI